MAQQHQQQPQPPSLNHYPASGGLPLDVVCSTETALEFDEMEDEAREDLADYFKEDRLRMGRAAAGEVHNHLGEDSLDKERLRHEQQLLMSLRNGCHFLEEKLDVIHGLEAWLERIKDEIQKVNVALEGISDHRSRINEYSLLAERMDMMFSQLFS